MLLVWTWGKLREGSDAVVITPIHFFLLFFSAALGISAMFSAYPAQSWFGTLQHGTGAVYVFLFGAWAILIGSLIHHRLNFLTSFLGAVFATGVIVAILTFWNNTGGPIGNTSYTGAYLLFCACFGIGLLWYYRSLWKKLLVGMGIITIFICPIFLHGTVWRNGMNGGLEDLVGQAQGATMGLVLAIAIIGILALVRLKRQWIGWIGAMFFVVLITMVWYGGKQFMNPDTSLHQYVVEHKSANRFLFLDVARAGLNERPLTGYGWGNYDMVFQRYFDPIIFTSGYGAEPSVAWPHNILWEYASTTGVLGLVAYIGLFSIVFLSLFITSRDENREKRIFGIVIAGVLVGYLFQNMFVFDTPVTYLMYFSAIGAAIGMSKGNLIPIRKVSLRIFSTAACTVSCATFVWLSVLPWYEASKWTKSITDQALETGKSPQYISPIGTSSDTAYIASKLYARSRASALSEAQKDFFIKKFSLFVNYLEEDIINNSQNYKTYLMKGILGNGLISFLGKSDSKLLSAAHDGFEKAILINPQSPEPYLNRAQTAVYEHNFADAYAYIRAGITIAPQYGNGYDIANVLLKIAPNHNFERYVTFMKKKWMSSEEQKEILN